MPLLEVKHVNTSYTKTQILWDITFSIEKGEVVALLGPNGAGKSTLLKTILGLTRLNSGEIYFAGKNISKAPPYERVKEGMALVPERGGLFPELTVLENLEVSAQTRSKEDLGEELSFVFDLFPALKHRLKQKAGSLSGGEQRMLLIARTLLLKPKLLMLDEPSSGLAPVIVHSLFETIKQINLSGVTILLAEQSLQEALSMSTKALLIEEGRIILEDFSKNFIDNERVRKAYLGI